MENVEVITDLATRIAGLSILVRAIAGVLTPEQRDKARVTAEALMNEAFKKIGRVDPEIRSMLDLLHG